MCTAGLASLRKALSSFNNFAKSPNTNMSMLTGIREQTIRKGDSTD